MIGKVKKKLEKPGGIDPRAFGGGKGIKVGTGDLVVLKDPFSRFKMPPEVIRPKFVGGGKSKPHEEKKQDHLFHAKNTISNTFFRQQVMIY